MKNPKSQIHGKRPRYRYGMLGAGILLMAATLVGCQGADSDSGPSALGLTSPETSTAAGRFAPPPFEELVSDAELTAEQSAELQSAFDQWIAAMQERQATRESDGRRGGRRFGGERGARPEGIPDGERPLHAFLVECAEILEPAQFVTVVENLAEWRTAQRESMAGARPERPEGFKGRGGRGGQFGGDKRGRFTEELNLTEEQQTALQTAREQSHAEIQALIEAAGGREQVDEATREKIRAIRDGMKELMESILTPEQLAQLENKREERRAEMADKREANFTQNLERRLGFLTRVLDLNETQKQQITDILTQSHEQLQSLHQTARDEDKSHEDVRTEAGQIRDESKAAIKELLSAEQAAMFEALSSLLPQRHGPRRGFGRGM